MTPIIAAALARKPRRNPRAIAKTPGRGGGKSAPDNYVAEAGKKPVGAPLGNRNAAAHGARSRDSQVRRDALLRDSLVLAAWAEALAEACRAMSRPAPEAAP